MLALCLMLSATYHAQNYAGVIGGFLQTNLRTETLEMLFEMLDKSFSVISSQLLFVNNATQHEYDVHKV